MAQAYSWPALSVGTGSDFAELREAARSQGYEDGYSAGHQQARSELEQIRLDLSESLRSIPGQIETFNQQDEQTLLAMIRSLCAALLGVELTTNPQILESIVTEAVERLNAQRSALTLVIAPEDESWVNCEGVTIVIDPAQKTGAAHAAQCRGDRGL